MVKEMEDPCLLDSRCYRTSEIDSLEILAAYAWGCTGYPIAMVMRQSLRLAFVDSAKGKRVVYPLGNDRRRGWRASSE